MEQPVSFFEKQAEWIFGAGLILAGTTPTGRLLK